jgi:prolyl oligopeptidase
MTPPRTRREAVVDTLHGVEVSDPYRWLEQGDDPDVQRWVAEQNRHTRSALDAIPQRGVWLERLVALMGLPVVQAVQVRGDRLIVLEREPGAQQARLVVRSLADPGAGASVLADPAAGSDDAASAVDWFHTSPDGELVAYGVSEGGTENSVLRVVRTLDGSLLADEIPNSRACSVGWEPDASGFFYTRYPEGDEYNRAVHHHTLGAAWPDDPLIWADHPTPQTWPNVSVSPEGRFVLVDAIVGWGRTDLHLLDRYDGTWRDAISGVEVLNHQFAFSDELTLIGISTLDAPRGRVVRIALDAPDISPDAWHTIVPESAAVIGAVEPVAGGVYVGSTQLALDRVQFVPDGGEPHTIDGFGTCSIAQIEVDRSQGTALVVAAGFDEPAAIWLIHADHTAHRLHPDIDRGGVPELDVAQVEFESADGTPVPMFVINRAGAVPEPGRPTILTGYGGFAITESPVWSPTIAAWCAAGGQYAIAGLRGGSEHGEDWHDAGRRGNKQNVFDDFHAAADWLVTTGHVSRDRLAIAGGSNGGLLVGAALTQRPDLCRAVWCAVPLLDMVRFPEFLIARLWTDEYGDPGVAEEFGWLHAYSPYHHVSQDVEYPAVLLTTAEGDTRVDPLHARKMAAQLQWAATGSPQPVLLHQEGRAGHGVGKPVGKRAAEQADVLAFFSWQLGD